MIDDSRTSIGRSASAVGSTLGRSGGRTYLLHKLASGIITARCRTQFRESLQLGPFPAVLQTDVDISADFWASEWAHDNERILERPDGRWLQRISLSSDWISGDFARVLTWGNPLDGRLSCRRVSGVTIAMSDHLRLMSDIGPATAAPPIEKSTYADVVGWCRRYLAAGLGNDCDVAMAAFKLDPLYNPSFSRDDVFRPAWKEAKTG